MAHRFPALYSPQRANLDSNLPSTGLGDLARLVVGSAIFLPGSQRVFALLLARPVLLCW